MIGTITLNPTVDRRYLIKTLAKNTVSRTDKYEVFPGGKGINASKVLRILNNEVTAFGFLGGFTGEFVRTELNEIGVIDQFTIIDGSTRTCVNIIDSNSDNIEVLEKGPLISRSSIDELLDNFKKEVKHLEVVAIGGSLPQGVEIDIYSELIEIATSRGKKVILDTSGDALLKNLKAKPFLIKPNRDELSQISNIELDSEAAIKRAGSIALEKGARNVAVSLGGQGMYFFGEEGNYKVTIPKIDVQNAVGSGDSSVAGFAYSFSKGYDIELSLKYANACGMSNATFIETGVVELDQVNKFIDQIQVEKI